MDPSMERGRYYPFEGPLPSESFIRRLRFEHLIRARNGDTSYFKRTTNIHWPIMRDGKGDHILSVAFINLHIHCAKVIYGRYRKLLYERNNKDENTVLHHVAYRAKSKPSMIRFVLSVADAKLHRMSNRNGDTALQESIKNQNLDAVEFLVQDPCGICYIDGNGLTPLMNALSFSYGNSVEVKIRRLLLEKQPDASKIGSGINEWTALHEATSKGDLHAIEDIIRFCPDSVDMVDKQGRDFLDIAIEYKQSEVVNKVLHNKEVWDSILKGNNIQKRTKMEFFLSDYERKTKELLELANKMCIPPNHLELYTKLVNQFGEIVDPSSKHVHDDHDTTSIYEALGCFLSDVSEMVHIERANVSEEKILAWEKKSREYSSLGLQVSWFQKLIARYRDWFHFENEIETRRIKSAQKNEVYQKKLSELQSLRNKLEEINSELKELDTELKELASELKDLHTEQEDIFSPEFDPLSVFRRND